MSTFKQKVENYCSSTDNDTVLADMLSSSAKEVLSRVPLPVLNRYATNADVTDANGYDSTDKKILSLNRSGYDVKEVGLGKKAAVSDSNSIHFATKRTPVFYFDGKLITAIPIPDSTDKLNIKFIAYMDVAVTDTDITSLPSTAHQAVVLRSSEKWLVRQIGVIKDSLPASVTISAFNPSSQLPSITGSPYTGLASVTYDSTGTATTVASVSNASKGTVAVPGSAPAYTPAGSSVDYNIDTIGVDPLLTAEEIELAQIALQKEAQKLQDYQIDTQNAQNEFQENATHYQAQVQETIQNAQGDTQVSLQNMQKDLAIAQQNAQTEESRALNNKIQETQEIIANNTFLLNRFNTEMQKFQSSLAKEMQVYQTNFQKDVQVLTVNADNSLKKIQVLGGQINSVKEMYQFELTRIAELI